MENQTGLPGSASMYLTVPPKPSAHQLKLCCVCLCRGVPGQMIHNPTPGQREAEERAPELLTGNQPPKESHNTTHTQWKALLIGSHLLKETTPATRLSQYQKVLTQCSNCPMSLISVDLKFYSKLIYARLFPNNHKAQNNTIGTLCLLHYAPKNKHPFCLLFFYAEKIILSFRLEIFKGFPTANVCPVLGKTMTLYDCLSYSLLSDSVLNSNGIY